MPTNLELQCAQVLHSAASADLGIVLRTNNPTKARASLYNTRKMLSDPVLDNLHIRVSPNDSENEIWIIKRNITQGFNIGGNEVAQNNR